VIAAFALPPAEKVAAVIVAVYPTIQLLKRIPAVTAFLTGWKAIALNAVLSGCGLFVVPPGIPPDQLYTLNTAILLVTTILGSAGVHGTISAMSQPQVLATIPPSKQVVEVPATLEPVDPKAVATSKEGLR
jgi:hypothetical protein